MKKTTMEHPKHLSELGLKLWLSGDKGVIMGEMGGAIPPTERLISSPKYRPKKQRR
jgi:hypothetical protein